MAVRGDRHRLQANGIVENAMHNTLKILHANGDLKALTRSAFSDATGLGRPHTGGNRKGGPSANALQRSRSVRGSGGAHARAEVNAIIAAMLAPVRTMVARWRR